MSIERLQSGSQAEQLLSARRLYSLLACRAYSVIMFAALFCTLAVKLFHAWRVGLLGEYFSWVLADIAVLLQIEVVLAVLCFRWPRRWVIRTACIVAAVVCTWSVMNAGWLIRTGTQILPTVLLPLVRDPLNALGMIGVNLVKMPAAAVILLGPSAVALAFFFSVLLKPPPPRYSRRLFADRVVAFVLIAVVAVLAHSAVAKRGSSQIASEGLSYNSQLKAVTSFLFPESTRQTRTDLANAARKIPAFDDAGLALLQKPHGINHNLIIVVLEGIQYQYTSLADRQSDLTPYLATLARQGAEFPNARSSLTHTTKVLFSLLTGRFPSVSQDLAEAVPAPKPYASLATILKGRLNFRTAFFQSAKGNFESRPALVYNLGFDKFWARDDLNNPNDFVGYLACDEFSMLKPITDWIKADQSPFFLTILCSVTHDPYEVPQWFAEPADDLEQRYRQAVSYTDRFLAALDVELARLNLTNKTILCVIADHAEAFGEHGLFGHERIAFDEVLRIPFCLRAPFLVQPQTTVTEPVSSVDLAPTLLALLGFDADGLGLDGVNLLGPIPQGRKVYFSGWLRQSPAGFVKDNRKFVYNPANKMVSVYDLAADPFELNRTELPQQQAKQIAEEIIAWRNDSVFRLDQPRTGRRILFRSWQCRWNDRVASAKYQPRAEN